MSTTQYPTDEILSDLLLTPRELARLAKVAEGTISNWRWQGMGPAFHKLGGAIRYRRGDVVEWLATRRVQTQQAG